MPPSMPDLLGFNMGSLPNFKNWNTLCKPQTKICSSLVYIRYNMPPDEMIIDHLPVFILAAASIQCRSIHFDFFGTEKAYLRNRVEGPFYNYKDSRDIAFSMSFLIGSSFLLNYNDTNDFRYGFSQERFVYESLVKYQGQNRKISRLRVALYRVRYAELFRQEKPRSKIKNQRKRNYLLIEKQKDRYKRSFVRTIK